MNRRYAWSVSASANMDNQVCDHSPSCPCAEGGVDLPLSTAVWGPFGSEEKALAGARAAGWSPTDVEVFEVRQTAGQWLRVPPVDLKAVLAAPVLRVPSYPASYVLGLAFDPHATQVVLIHKRRGPAAVVNRLNGLGGKIEPGESPCEAMRREFCEECGVDTHQIGWLPVVRLYRPGVFEVYVMTTRLTMRAFDAARTATDEQVWHVALANALSPHWRSVSSSDKPGVVPNLRWMIPMALDPSLDRTTFVDVLDVAN